MLTFNQWFEKLTERAPHPWQGALGDARDCPSRLIRIPTGFGKTLGVLCTWLYHRVHCKDDRWPRRLIWILPMRVLVEQTAAEAQALSDAAESGVKVHILMGGLTDMEWQNKPEECAILVGTHDMLLSRALNRGYAAPRARWPMEFGLLNHDTLWVMDEVQLMDVGLATSAQLQAFREQDREKALRPCVSWWMSATLQRDWLKSVDTKALVEALELSHIPKPQRKEELWNTTKPVTVLSETEDLKTLVLERHAASRAGEYGRITLVILNTVDRTLDLYRKLKLKPPPGTDIRLVHSRFRPHDRANWRETFLCKDACKNADRIIVATQVVEAGVDVSATTLITDLAPWSSLVQRFGRAARWGGSADIVVLSNEFKSDKESAPYKKIELDAARDLALKRLDSAAQAALEDFEAALSGVERAQLYPYQPAHLLLRHEWDELFDTTPDLSGADIDISRFIRCGEERDVQVFWREMERDEKTRKVKAPGETIQPRREELCAVSFLKAQKWLCGDSTKAVDAWVWDWLDDQWRPALRRDIYPGQTVLVDAAVGGYNAEQGWSPADKSAVSDLSKLKSVPPVTPEIEADLAQEKETLSEAEWKTIATHGREAGAEARAIAAVVAPEMADLLDLAGRWHDIGKAHDSFQGSMRHKDRPARTDLAKAPQNAWPRGALYRAEKTGDHRPGLRHELASMLALFAVLIRHNPVHAALLGPWRELLAAADAPSENNPEKAAPPSAIEKEILALSAEDFDLLAYLVCSHHGKVRQALHASPADQDYPNAAQKGAPIRGICKGDVLPGTILCGRDGEPEKIAALTLSLAPAEAGLSHITGRSWTERALELVRRHGPAKLAWLEALLRAADVRASKKETVDPLLKEVRA